MCSPTHKPLQKATLRHSLEFLLGVSLGYLQNQRKKPKTSPGRCPAAFRENSGPRARARARAWRHPCRSRRMPTPVDLRSRCRVLAKTWTRSGRGSFFRGTPQMGQRGFPCWCPLKTPKKERRPQQKMVGDNCVAPSKRIPAIGDSNSKARQNA